MAKRKAAPPFNATQWGPPFKRPHKYKAIQTEYDGVKYPSKAEALRAMVLDEMLKGNEIDWWLRQVPVRLGPDTIYRVDFLVARHVRSIHFGEPVVVVTIHAEDVKGVETRAFGTIRKLWVKYGPFDLHVINRKTVEILTPDPRED